MSTRKHTEKSEAIERASWCEERLDALIRDIYQGILEEVPWSHFSENLRRYCDCDVAGLSLDPAQPGLRSVSIWRTREPIPDTVREQAAAQRMVLASSDPLANALRHSGDIHTLSEVIDTESFHRSEYYRNFCRPFGLEYQLALCIAEQDWICHVGLMNGPGGCDFGQREKAVLQRLQPHLEHALTLYTKLKDQETEKAVYRDVLDKLGIGTIMLNNKGEVIDTNPLARRIITSNPCLRLLQGRVVASSRPQTTRLRELIARGLEHSEQPGEQAFSEVIRLGCRGESLDLLVRSISPCRWYRHPGRARLALYISHQGSLIPPYQSLSQLLGLTPSEARLAMLLARGFTIAEAAKELGITENSARTYSKKIFSKTGTRRQAELVRIVLKSVALLDDH